MSDIRKDEYLVIIHVLSMLMHTEAKQPMYLRAAYAAECDQI